MAIRERHVERFREPNLHGKLINRIVMGNMVIDHETVTRTFTEGPGEIDVICIYEIAEGKIAKAGSGWVRRGSPAPDIQRFILMRRMGREDEDAVEFLLASTGAGSEPQRNCWSSAASTRSQSS